MTNTAVAVALLREAYPRQEFPDKTIAVYGRQLSNLDPDLVTAAVSRLIDTSKFLPSIAEIKSECAEIALGLPTPEEAWEIAQTGSLRQAPEPVRVAAEYVGGRWSILNGDSDAATVRSQFRKAYVSARDQAVRDFISPRAQPAGLSRANELSPAMLSLPESERFRPRPVMERLMRRWGGQAVGPPTEEEKSDAIRVLEADEDLWCEPGEDPLYAEAERIFRDGAS